MKDLAISVCYLSRWLLGLPAVLKMVAVENDAVQMGYGHGRANLAQI